MERRDRAAAPVGIIDDGQLPRAIRRRRRLEDHAVGHEPRERREGDVDDIAVTRTAFIRDGSSLPSRPHVGAPQSARAASRSAARGRGSARSGDRVARVGGVGLDVEQRAQSSTSAGCPTSRAAEVGSSMASTRRLRAEQQIDRRGGVVPDRLGAASPPRSRRLQLAQELGGLPDHAEEIVLLRVAARSHRLPALTASAIRGLGIRSSIAVPLSPRKRDMPREITPIPHVRRRLPAGDDVLPSGTRREARPDAPMARRIRRRRPRTRIRSSTPAWRAVRR